MKKYEKVYIAVNLHVDTDGFTRIKSIEWQDGRIYNVDKMLFERMAPPEHIGAILTRRYDLIIEGKEKIIYLETESNRWFVEKPLL